MNDKLEGIFDRLIPWVSERTGVDQEIILKVIEGQALFCDAYQSELEEIEQTLDEDDDDED